MKRRTFLQLVAAAPLAAAGVRPVLSHYHATLGPVAVDWGAGDSCSVWLFAWGEERPFGLVPGTETPLYYVVDELGPALDDWQLELLAERFKSRRG